MLLLYILPTINEGVLNGLLLDKALARKVKPGEEDNIEDIAIEVGTIAIEHEAVEAAKLGGQTVVSGETLTRFHDFNAVSRDFGKPCKGGYIIIIRFYAGFDLTCIIPSCLFQSTGRKVAGALCS